MPFLINIKKCILKRKTLKDVLLNCFSKIAIKTSDPGTKDKDLDPQHCCFYGENGKAGSEC